MRCPVLRPSANIRLTGGFTQLNDGFKLLPVLIGLYAISQIVEDILKIERKGNAIEMNRTGMFMNLKDWGKQWWNLVRSSLIGTWIGLLPGIGANIGSVVAYTTAKNRSKRPDEFGQGSEEGIVASEAANNATVGGSTYSVDRAGDSGKCNRRNSCWGR